MIRSLTYTLHKQDPDSMLDAIAALASSPCSASVEALFDVLSDPPNSNVAVAAIAALKGVEDDPRAHEALRAALDQPSAQVRRAALVALLERTSYDRLIICARVLHQETSWKTRALAIAPLLDAGREGLLLATVALNDPHWRVRSTLIRAVIERGDMFLSEFIGFIEQESDFADPQRSGVLQYLKFRLGGRAGIPQTTDASPQPSRPVWWDDDPPVTRRNLAAMTPNDLKQALEHLPEALTLDDTKGRRLAAKALVRYGKEPHLAACVRLLDDPRRPFVSQEVTWILGRLNRDRRDALVRWLTEHDNLPIPSTARLALALTARPDPTAPDVLARVQHAQALAQRNHPEAAQALESLAHDPDHRVREAALTEARARLLWADPQIETSWRVLARAARLVRAPLSKIAPPRFIPPTISQSVAPQARPGPVIGVSVHPNARVLGTTGLKVAPLGISGHYGLPAQGYAQAMQAGVNLFFWEPGYTEQTRFLRGLPSARADGLVIVCGTFEAESQGIRRDVERALKQLRRDCIDLFLVFWVRSWGRLEGGVVETLHTLRDEGLIRHFSLSTHARWLAVEALKKGWEPIMSRHSAAHRGLEHDILPEARRRGAGVITFSNLCYGRLLKHHNGHASPEPMELYRYSLSQPGVTCCLSAPSTLAQLAHNLQVLNAPTLEPDRIEALRAYGDQVYADNRAFRELILAR